MYIVNVSTPIDCVGGLLTGGQVLLLVPVLQSCASTAVFAVFFLRPWASFFQIFPEEPVQVPSSSPEICQPDVHVVGTGTAHFILVKVFNIFNIYHSKELTWYILAFSRMILNFQLECSWIFQFTHTK